MSQNFSVQSKEPLIMWQLLNCRHVTASWWPTNVAKHNPVNKLHTCEKKPMLKYQKHKLVWKYTNYKFIATKYTKYTKESKLIRHHNWKFNKHFYYQNMGQNRRFLIMKFLLLAVVSWIAFANCQYYQWKVITISRLKAIKN